MPCVSTKLSRRKRLQKLLTGRKVFLFVACSRAWIKTSFYNYDFLRYQESDKLEAKQFTPRTMLRLISEDVMRPYSSCYMNIFPVIHVPHTTAYVEQWKGTGPAGPEWAALVPTIKLEERVVDKALSHQNRGRGFQFLTVVKCDPHHGAA